MDWLSRSVQQSLLNDVNERKSVATNLKNFASCEILNLISQNDQHLIEDQIRWESLLITDFVVLIVSSALCSQAVTFDGASRSDWQSFWVSVFHFPSGNFSSSIMENFFVKQCLIFYFCCLQLVHICYLIVSCLLYIICFSVSSAWHCTFLCM